MKSNRVIKVFSKNKILKKEFIRENKFSRKTEFLRKSVVFIVTISMSDNKKPCLSFLLSYPMHSFQMPDSDASFLFCHSHVLPLFREVDSCPFPALLLSVGMLFSVQSLVIALE